MLFNDNSLSIGNTPLVRINRITRGFPATVLAKIEGRNPAYSVKCRVAASMIWEAEKAGILKPGNAEVTVVEPTSGNTGIGLAFVCAARGYPLILTMPDTMSIERRRMLAAYGAKVVLTEGSWGMNGAIEEAEKLVASDPVRFFIPQQFKNPANPEIHYKTTGPEIFNDTSGKIDIFVAGVGTGGTITGVSRYLKQKMGLPVWTVAVEPESSRVLASIKAGEPTRHAGHKIQGIGAGFKPDILDLDLVDEVAAVSNDEAFEFARRLHREEGITCGISCGAAMAVAARLAQKPENAGKTIVTVFPDSGERYISTALFEGI